MIRRMFVAGCLVALALYAGTAPAGEKAQPGGASKEAAEAAKKLLLEHLGDKVKNAQVVAHIDAPALHKSFPGYEFFAVRFRIYPVARMIPKGLKASNVFAVSKDGKVDHLKDAKALEAFFHNHGMAAKSEKAAGNLVQGWLWLSQEFVQDGYYKFTIGKPDVKTENGKVGSASGTAVVMAGGNGEMQAMLTFDQAGKVDMVAHTEKIRRGPRPICQATKLLDPDPIVRRMAEQDLLYLGLAARDYLMEQRAAAASPELRRAIDRLWERIQKEGW
jgi:hypothetical protein